MEAIELAVLDAMVKGYNGKVNVENLKTELLKISDFVEADDVDELTGNGPWIITGKKSKEQYRINTDATVSLAEKTKITVNGQEVDLSALDAESVAQYYGTIVKRINNINYVLFYVDYDGVYSGGEKGTVFLKAQTSIGDMPINGLLTGVDQTKAVEIMKQINPGLKASGRGNVAYNNYTENEKGATYLCNPNNANWVGIGNSFNANDLNYVIGGASVELFLASYNAKYPNSTPKCLAQYNLNGELNSSYTQSGYLFSLDEGTTYNNAVSFWPSGNEGIDEMYRGNSQPWLASPVSDSTYQRVGNVAPAGGLMGSLVTLGNNVYNFGVEPLISLKPGVDLTTN